MSEHVYTIDVGTRAAQEITPDRWKEVKQGEFWKIIGPTDVVGEVQGKYPYTYVLKTRRGEVRGVIGEHLAPGTHWPPIKNYFVPKPHKLNFAV